MKLLLFIALATLVLAAKPLFTVILTYTDDTPAWAINQDMQNIVDAVCLIEYAIRSTKLSTVGWCDQPGIR